MGFSNALDPEFFRRTALFTCEREILEFPTEQNWYDADNDHFRSAERTRRRSPGFWWHFLTSYVISFRRSGQRIPPRQPPSLSNQGITLTHLVERDESPLIFVPEHQPHAPETLA